nr:hypothetical protein [uncultured Fluviicola sp.]
MFSISTNSPTKPRTYRSKPTIAPSNHPKRPSKAAAILVQEHNPDLKAPASQSIAYELLSRTRESPTNTRASQSKTRELVSEGREVFSKVHARSIGSTGNNFEPTIHSTKPLINSR